MKNNQQKIEEKWYNAGYDDARLSFAEEIIKKIRKELWCRHCRKDLPYKHIVCDEDILGGIPVVKGTRVSVSAILGHIATNGGNIKGVLNDYPQLREPQVREALKYAALNIEQQHAAS